MLDSDFEVAVSRIFDTRLPRCFLFALLLLRMTTAFLRFAVPGYWSRQSSIWFNVSLCLRCIYQLQLALLPCFIVVCEMSLASPPSYETRWLRV